MTRGDRIDYWRRPGASQRDRFLVGRRAPGAKLSGRLVVGPQQQQPPHQRKVKNSNIFVGLFRILAPWTPAAASSSTADSSRRALPLAAGGRSGWPARGHPPDRSRAWPTRRHSAPPPPFISGHFPGFFRVLVPSGWVGSLRLFRSCSSRRGRSRQPFNCAAQSMFLSYYIDRGSVIGAPSCTNGVATSVPGSSIHRHESRNGTGRIHGPSDWPLAARGFSVPSRAS